MSTPQVSRTTSASIRPSSPQLPRVRPMTSAVTLVDRILEEPSGDASATAPGAAFWHNSIATASEHPKETAPVNTPIRTASSTLPLLLREYSTAFSHSFKALEKSPASLKLSLFDLTNDSTRAKTAALQWESIVQLLASSFRPFFDLNFSERNFSGISLRPNPKSESTFFGSSSNSNQSQQRVFALKQITSVSG